MVRYAILGPVELCDGERRVPVGGRRQVALLALLLVNANRALSYDRLIDALWDDLGPAALRRLQAAILRLRRTLDARGVRGESVLRTVAGGYLLAVGPGELDGKVFAARVAEGRDALGGGEIVRAREVLGETLAMWRGPALAEVAYAEFAQPEIRRLEELRLAALEARMDCELGLGEHSAVIAELEALVAANPGRERLAGQLMLALYRSGRQGDALDAFARTRAYLAGELGLEPGPALRTLQAEILAQSPALQSFDDCGLAVGVDGPASEQTGVAPTGVVTFLLTDIEDSTRLWGSDPDAMAAALEAHDRLIASLVQRHGGRLLKDKSEGDATLSVFQRASGAVACAAELQRAVMTASGTMGFALRVRVALHSGEAQERDGDYFGAVLNRAARLRSLAPGGVTVLSQSTAELVRDRLAPQLQLVDVGSHELRDLSRPERVFELRTTTGASAQRGATEPVMLSLPRALHAPAGFPFVGREQELARLREHWTQIEEHGRSAVVIGGEAGIGKTRLASELAREAHGEGALVLYGRCDEGLAVPYQPFVEALGPYARAVGLDRLRGALGHRAPELGRLLPELAALGEPTRADPESERFALFEAVAALIEAMTRQQRALLILDDLHWAATPTLLMLRHLIRSERALDVLVLATYRETELDRGASLAQLLADLQRDASAQRLSIGGLDEQAITALLQAVTGQALDERDVALVQLVRSQTGGNAFFISALLAHLCESGAVHRTGQRRTYDLQAAEVWVPEGLGEVICHRVARLSPPARRALSVGAVAGPTFSFALLEHVIGDSEDVLGALEEAVAAGLLSEAGPASYAFAHALVRQVLYAALSATRRMRLHRQLGEALEALSDADAHAAVLAHHFAQAAADGQADKAAAYALAAGRSATARLGYEEAAAHYEQGLQALTVSERPNEQRRCELLLALGDARWGTGELDNARQACQQAAGLAETLGDATAMARAALGFCGFHRPEWHATVTGPIAKLLQRALAMLDNDDSALRAQLMGRLAGARAYSAVEQRSPELARQALEMARRIADKATLADVLASTIWATRSPDSLQQSLAMATELQRIADEIADVELRAAAHVWLIDLLLELGDINAVKHELDALQRLVQTRPERLFRWVVAALRANDALLGGQLEVAETLAHDALTHSYEGNDEIAARVFAVQMFILRSAQGRLAELVHALEAFVAQFPDIAAGRCVLAYIYTRLDRTADARQELAALASEDFEDLPRDLNWLPSLATLSEVVVFLDDAPRAEQLYKLLLPYADRNVVTGLLLGHGSASRTLGTLTTTLARYEDAQRHFEQALTMHTQIRAPIFIAQTQHDYARMLLRRNHPGDRDKALDLLKHALATAEQLGLKTLADNASLLKQATAPKPPRSDDSPPHRAIPDAR